MMGLQKEPFGRLNNGQLVEKYRMTSAAGMQVEIITYGAAVVRLLTPDRQGNLADVVLGYDTLQDYVNGNKFFGAVIGRYANRIAGAGFSRNGKSFRLPPNEPSGATLHGGNGFDRKLWTVVGGTEGDQPSLCLSYHSKDGEEGFPGALDAEVTYTLKNDGALEICYRAQSNQETPVNLTNHSYFNLTGDPSRSVLSHELQIDGALYTPVDADGIPTGELLAVAGTPLDFTCGKSIGQDIGSHDPQIVQSKGYDHNFVLSSGTGIRRAARVYEPCSGRVMEVFTDKPGMQLYTANYLDGSDIGKGGIRLGQYSALCLETQYFPDSVHQPQFPSPFYRAGEPYRFTTRYCFSCK
jgi:aldose 1-epimerase